MRIIVDNFLQLSAQNAGGVVVWSLLAIYAGVLLTTFLDIITRKRPLGFKLVWSVVALVLPFVGMAFYGIFSLLIAEYPLITQLGFKSSKVTKKTHAKACS